MQCHLDHAKRMEFPSVNLTQACRAHLRKRKTPKAKSQVEVNGEVCRVHACEKCSGDADSPQVGTQA